MVIVNGRFLLHRITGVERYAIGLCAELDKLIAPDQIIMAVPPEVNNIPEYQNIKVVRVGKLHNRLWEHISFPGYVIKQHGVSLNLCNVAPIPRPDIVCIHDVKLKAMPQFFNKKFLIWYTLLLYNETKRAREIITVSEFSKKELVKYYHVKPSAVNVINSTWQLPDEAHAEEFAETVCEKYNVKKGKYFFALSSIEPNKNVRWIAEVAKGNKDFTFLVGGTINSSVFNNYLGFECPQNMRLLGYISDQDARSLMSSCKAFLFPTFYEGFGLPPLEAYSAGCNCAIVSDTEVMHEVYGDAAVYINPYKYDYYLGDLKGFERSVIDELLSKYSWEKSAMHLKKIIEKYM